MLQIDREAFKWSGLGFMSGLLTNRTKENNVTYTETKCTKYLLLYFLYLFVDSFFFSLPAASFVPSKSSSRIMQPSCHARLEPQCPLLIAAMKLREEERAEAAHKHSGRCKANRQKGKGDEPSQSRGIPP